MKTPKPDHIGISLMIDIENCIKAQQSTGYKHLAKIENLKRATRTMAFLDQNGIEKYADLERRIVEFQDTSKKTTAALKDAERRLSGYGAAYQERMLVSSIIGLDYLATMDIDTIVRNIPLSADDAKVSVEELATVPVEDNILFEIKDVSTNMYLVFGFGHEKAADLQDENLRHMSIQKGMLLDRNTPFCLVIHFFRQPICSLPLKSVDFTWFSSAFLFQRA